MRFYKTYERKHDILQSENLAHIVYSKTTCLRYKTYKFIHAIVFI